MSKLAVDRLVDEVQDELVTFLQSGTIAEADVVSTLDFTDLEIDDFARLKRIHFCLSDPVVDFVEKLPERVRSIKTANQRERVHTRGEVRGASTGTRRRSCVTPKATATAQCSFARAPTSSTTSPRIWC